ncbi:MAG: hypothetical protein WBG71_11035 [Leeuwenhoekiella sp.]
MVLILMASVVSAQVDKTNAGGFKIPAKEDTSIPIIPEIKPEPTLKAPDLTLPDRTSTPETPRNPVAKSFNMMDDPLKDFQDPTIKYTQLLNDRLNEQIKERIEIPGTGSKQDKNYGTFTTNSREIRVLCRDFGRVDGDIVSVSLNDNIQIPRLGLGYNYSAVPLVLEDGINKIAITALTQGTISPNTAEFIVIDGNGNEIFRDQWNLSNGYSAKFAFVKN